MDELLSSLLSLCMNYCPPYLLYGLKCMDDYEFVYDFMSLYALWLFFMPKGETKLGLNQELI